MITAEPISAPAPDWSKKLRTTAGDKAELLCVLNCPYEHGQRVVKVTQADGTQNIWRCKDDGCPVGIPKSMGLRVVNDTLHRCEASKGLICEETDDGMFLMDMKECLSTQVNFCPFCGAAAKVKA